jgi:class 3 adenylate cyclase/HAMP domain-containing protein
MSIRLKIILVVLPLIVATILLAGVTSRESARAGITRVAVEALGFKAQELQKYADNQWNLLVSNDLAEQTEYLAVTKLAIESYANTIIRSESELIIAANAEGLVELQTSEINLDDPAEISALVNLATTSAIGWQEIVIEGELRVGQAFVFDPFGWYVLVTDTSANFYREVDAIQRRTWWILGGSSGAAIFLLLLFAGVLTGPLSRMVGLMSEITETNDLSQRVDVEYKDEIGAMARTFNVMLSKLETATDQIKSFALGAVIARRNERKIRSIFQKYVPKDVIDSIFSNPESALTGENRVLAILFTDIRSFTTISESFMPDELVKSLNNYFEIMVDIIDSHKGITDKYIGDAIMAFFGAPVKHDNDPLEALTAALEMQVALRTFNEAHVREGKPIFKTGIGVNYGVVTVGNIGSEKKMDYTIIGDSVNLGSRLEGLTKEYGQDVIFSESVFRKVKTELPCRLIDAVQVKGKTEGVKIFTAELKLAPRQEKAWGYHHAGMKRYFNQEFRDAAQFFAAVKKLLPGDSLADMYLERCRTFLKSPPPKGWNGVYVMTKK